MPEKKIKDCARCGLEFTFERSTAKYCSDSCRRYVNIKAQRKRIKRNTDRRILRDLQRRWRNLEEHRGQFDCDRYDLMVDQQGGCSLAQDKIDQIDREVEAHKPYWERDERTIRKDAEELGVDWDRVAGADKPVNKKPVSPVPVSERKPTHEVTAGARTMSYTPNPNRKRMEVAATTRKRKPIADQ